jgi:hypothetical protein
LDPTQPPIQWATGKITPGLKEPEREPDNSPSTRATVKNGGTIPSLSHTSSWFSAYLINHRDKYVFFPFAYKLDEIQCSFYTLHHKSMIDVSCYVTTKSTQRVTTWKGHP